MEGGSSAAADEKKLVEDLIAIVEEVKKIGEFRKTQRKQATNLVRRLKQFLLLLEEIRIPVRSALLEGGGVDVVNYGPNCTHAIVDKIVYDNPTCVAARRDGKILVTGLWVDDSFCMARYVAP